MSPRRDPPYVHLSISLRAREIERHEDAVGIGGVVAEWGTLDEPLTSIQRAGGVEVRPGPGLEADACHSRVARRIDDVPHDCGADALPAAGLRRVHRLDLAVGG